jgi:hypothetical protein
MKLMQIIPIISRSKKFLMKERASMVGEILK